MDARYRGAARSSDDATAAAMAELGARVARLRRWFLLPGALLALGFAIAGALLHIGGYWSVFGTFDDGSYMVAMPTVAVALAIPGGIAFGPVWVCYRGLRARIRRSWLRAAPARHGVDEEELRELAGLFD